MRVGLIGVGGFGSWHLKAYQEVFGVEVAMLADIAAERVATFSSQYAIPFTTDYKEILRRPDIDAVDICVPSALQPAMAIEALHAGKHVLAEKPLALSVLDGQRIVAAAQTAKRVLMVGHIERFNPSLRRAKVLLSEGRIGQPVKISAKRNSRRDKPDWQWEQVNILPHTACHDVDLMRWLMDDAVIKVYAEGASLIRTVPGQDDAVCLVLRFSRGGLGVLDDTWCLVQEFPTEENDLRVEVIGTEGSLHIQNFDQMLGLCETNRGWSFPSILRWPGIRDGAPGAESYALRDELQHFVRAVHGERPPIVAGEDAIETLRVIEAAERSLKQAQPVAV